MLMFASLLYCPLFLLSSILCMQFVKEFLFLGVEYILLTRRHNVIYPEGGKYIQDITSRLLLCGAALFITGWNPNV